MEAMKNLITFSLPTICYLIFSSNNKKLYIEKGRIVKLHQELVINDFNE